jgi:DNA-binding transcriptional LysR family regulator
MPTTLPALPRFTLRQLHYFVAVARCGQISAAATEVGLSQSAMTLAIADLEQAVGTALLERGRQGVTLTHQGQGFLQHAESVLRMANEAARFPFRGRDLEGKLELAATYTVLGYFLLPSLARFRELYPRVELSLEELPRKEIESRLASGELEMGALLLSNLETPDRLETRVLGRSRRQLWVAADHEYASRGSVTFEELAALTYLLPTVDEGDRNAMRYWADAGYTPHKLVQTSSMEALREMVALNLGVTILSDMVFRPWSLDGRRIHAVPMDARLPVMEVGLAWAAGRALSPCAAAMEQFLGRSFASGVPSGPKAFM